MHVDGTSPISSLVHRLPRLHVFLPLNESDIGRFLAPWFDSDEKEKLPDRPLYRIPEALALGNYTVSRWLVEATIMICKSPAPSSNAPLISLANSSAHS